MADTIIKKWNSTTSQWEEVNPQTTHTQIVASGTPSSTTFLRGDGTWATPSDVDTNNYLTGVSGSGDGTVTFTRSGLSNLTWDASHTHSEFAKRIDLSSQVQTSSYRKSVIALCNLDNSSTSRDSWSGGTIYFHRTNGLVAPVTLQITMEKRYNAQGANYTALVMSGNSYGDNIQYVQFDYNGTPYGGIEFYFSAAEHHKVYFIGESNFNIFGLDYYNTQTSTVLNSEVNNSISTSNMVAETDLFYNGSRIWTSSTDGSGSGLDADTLDTKHASDFVAVTGDTMTDTLTISAAKTTDDPLLKLVSTATGDGDAVIELEANDTGEAGIIFKNPDNTNAAGWFLGSGDAFSEHFYLYDLQNSATRFVVGHDGDVGIGTDSPSEKLQVDGNIKLNSTLPKIQFVDTDHNSDFEIRNNNGNLDVYDTTNARYITTFHSNGNVYNTGQTISYGNITISNGLPKLVLDDSNSDSDFHIANNNGVFEIADTTNQEERFAILSNGKVGIGTTSPTGKLEVVGDSGLYIKTTTNNPTDGAQIRFSDNASGGTYAQYGFIKYKHADTTVETEPTNSSDGFIIGGNQANTIVSIQGSLNVESQTNFENQVEIDSGDLLVRNGDLDVNGQAKIGSGLSSDRSTYGLTAGFTSNSTFSSNADVSDSNRTLSLVNESTTTNTYSTLSFRNSPSSGTSMADFKYVHRGTNSGDLIYTNNNGGTWTDQFSILSNGNVGIGTTSPASPLHTYKNTSSGSNVISLETLNNKWDFRIGNSGEFLIRDGSYDRLTINNSNGNATFANDLTVQGDLFVSGSFTTIDTDTTTTEQWSVTNDGTGPAVIINQKGSQPIIDIQDDGVSALYIADGGNVGIGDTTPTYKLEVAGDMAVNKIWDRNNGAYYLDPALTSNLNIVDANRFEASSTSTRDKFRVYPTNQYTIGMQSAVTYGGLNDWAMTFQFNNDNDRGFWWGDEAHSQSQGAMALTTNGLLTVANRIRVGYGESDTTIPSTYALDVSGQVQIDDYTSTRTAGLLKINSESGSGWDSQSGAALGKIQFWSKDASGIGEHEIGSIELENDGSNYYQPVPDMIFKTAVYNTAAAERMRITSDGKVGIGTSTPTEKLTVYGDSNISENSPVTFIKHNFTGTHGFGLSVSRDNSDVAALALGSNSSNHGIVVANNTDLVLSTISSGVINSGMTVKTSGNVGIGTTSPSQKLEVNGNIRTSSSLIAGANLYLNDDNTAADTYVYFGDAASDTAHYMRFTNASQQFTFSNRVVATAGRLGAIEYNGSDVDKVNFALSGSTLTITTS